MNLPKRYPYNPGWWAIIFAGAFFGACCWGMAYQATHNKAGLIINGIVTLEVAGATKFYWTIAGTSALFVVAAVLITIRRLANPQVLELGLDALLLPYGFLQTKLTTIRYADIQQVSEISVSGQTFLHLFTNGRKFTLMASLLPDQESYAEVREFLRAAAIKSGKATLGKV